MAVLDPPVPVLAQWFAFPGPELLVTFNRPLAPGPLAAANWSAVIPPNAYNATSASAAGSVVTAPMAPIGAGAGLQRCTYAAAPPDVLDAGGTPAAAFLNFPVA